MPRSVVIIIIIIIVVIVIVIAVVMVVVVIFAVDLRNHTAQDDRAVFVAQFDFNDAILAAK